MGNTRLLDRAYVVLMDPNTGEIKSLAGKRYVRDEKREKRKCRMMHLERSQLRIQQDQ